MVDDNGIKRCVNPTRLSLVVGGLSVIANKGRDHAWVNNDNSDSSYTSLSNIPHTEGALRNMYDKQFSETVAIVSISMRSPVD